MTTAVESLDARVALLERRYADLDGRLRRLEPEPARRAHPVSPVPRPENTPNLVERARPTPQEPRSTSPGEPAVSPHSPAKPPRVRRSAGRSYADLEQLLSGRLLAWAGGLAILLSAVFFVGLAFTRGWIGPGGRVGIGLAAGGVLLTAGARFFERRESLLGHALAATGLGTLFVSLVGATRLYHLVPVSAGLAGALCVAGVAAAIAIRAGAQVVAALGLLGALGAPPVMGASPDGTTILFLAAALCGTTAIALYRSWGWLPVLAWLLSFPQVGSWLEEGATLRAGLLALAGYWLLHALSAAGQSQRAGGGRLAPSSATLLLGNAAFGVGAGYALLEPRGEYAVFGPYLAALALAHLALAAPFLRRDADHPFGTLAAGAGIAALTMAVPVQLGGPLVPIAWASEAAALAWLYGRRRGAWVGAGAGVLCSLAAAHVLVHEYPPDLFGLFGEPPATSAIPFANAAGGTLAYVLLAFALAAVWVRSTVAGSALGTAGLLLAAWAMPWELSGPALVGGWCILSVLGVGASGGGVLARLLGRALGRVAPLRVNLYGGAGVAATLALSHLLLLDLPLWRIADSPAARPFTDAGTAAALLIVGGCLLAAVLAADRRLRRSLVVAAAAVAAYLMPFQLGEAATVVAWCALALALGSAMRADRGGGRAYGVASGFLVAIGLILTLEAVAPPERLLVDAATSIAHPPFWSGATAALGAVITVLLLAYREYRPAGWTGWLLALGAGLGVYALSVGVVDVFQARVATAELGGPLRATAKQAQVALSILWAALGGVSVVAGLLRGVGAARAGGLLLLGLATTKVFLYDLASLDATYRVPSFLGLGLLLLGSSYAYQRLRPSATSEAA